MFPFLILAISSSSRTLIEVNQQQFQVIRIIQAELLSKITFLRSWHQKKSEVYDDVKFIENSASSTGSLYEISCEAKLLLRLVWLGKAGKLNFLRSYKWIQHWLQSLISNFNVVRHFLDKAVANYLLQVLLNLCWHKWNPRSQVIGNAFSDSKVQRYQFDHL